MECKFCMVYVLLCGTLVLETNWILNGRTFINYTVGMMHPLAVNPCQQWELWWVYGCVTLVYIVCVGSIGRWPEGADGAFFSMSFLFKWNGTSDKGRKRQRERWILYSVVLMKNINLEKRTKRIHSLKLMQFVRYTSSMSWSCVKTIWWRLRIWSWSKANLPYMPTCSFQTTA